MHHCAAPCVTRSWRCVFVSKTRGSLTAANDHNKPTPARPDEAERRERTGPYSDWAYLMDTDTDMDTGTANNRTQHGHRQANRGVQAWPGGGYLVPLFAFQSKVNSRNGPYKGDGIRRCCCCCFLSLPRLYCARHVILGG